jgi:acyl dehydratase
MGMWFEDFIEGAVVPHAIRRTVTETDNVLFTTMTMNPQPMHLDHEFAATKEFGKPLVNSLFTLGLVVGLAVPELTLGTTVANLGFTQVDFPKPVFVGDTVHVETTIGPKRLSKSRAGEGIVQFDHRAYNQRSELVCLALRTALMRCRPEPSE